MSVLTMDMSSYEVERNTTAADEYGEEILCASWVPTLALQPAQDFENRASMPESLANVDAETFLRKMYVWQR